MEFGVGAIVDGKVTGITKFGAFVSLPDGKSGLVHISEIAYSYVNEVSDHLREGQEVKVKIIGINPEGKVSLSIKQAAPAPSAPPQRPFRSHQGGQQGDRPPRQQHQRRPPREASYGFERRQPITNENMSFEDMMSKFKQASDDKMSDLKRYTDVKRGTSRSRNSSR